MLDEKEYFKAQNDDEAYFLSEVATATKTGVYAIQLNEKEFFIDSIGRSILEIPEQNSISYVDLGNLFQDQADMRSLLQTCLKGEFFETDLAMISLSGTKIWMRFTGKPKYDRHKNIVGIRGVFTSIDKYIRGQEEVSRHSRIIEMQNERLLHYAHIISHNLRTRSSNLELALELFKDVEHDEKSKLFYSYVSEISQNLSATLSHLNQVVTIRTQSSGANVDIRHMIEKVENFYRHSLEECNAIVDVNLKELAYIEYVPAFLENILKTLISNAITHRSKDRQLLIKIYTRIKGDKRLLVVKDNGVGINLDKTDNKIFKVYENNAVKGEAKGLGLFLVKNQVEALGGDIVVKSKPHKGSKFTVKF